MSLEELQAGRCVAHVDLDGVHPWACIKCLREHILSCLLTAPWCAAAFYVQVEVKQFPSLKGKPVAVVQVRAQSWAHAARASKAGAHALPAALLTLSFTAMNPAAVQPQRRPEHGAAGGRPRVQQQQRQPDRGLLRGARPGGQARHARRRGAQGLPGGAAGPGMSLACMQCALHQLLHGPCLLVLVQLARR